MKQIQKETLSGLFKAVGQEYTQNRIEFVLSRHTSQPELLRQMLAVNHILLRRGQIYWRANKTLVEV